MRREIKFRVYAEGNMRDVDLLAYKKGILLFIYADNQQFQADEHPIMQFTGLKDKNGGEIYEGDILQIEDFTMAVEYIRETQHIDGYIGRGKSVQIIGNIYENTELLNAIEV